MYLYIILSVDNQDQREIQELLESYSQLSQKNNETISTLNQQLQSGELGAINTAPSWESTNIKAEPIDTHMSDDPTNIAIPKIIHRLKTEDMPITADSASETASAAAAAASMNAGSLIGSPLKTADGLAFVTLGRLSSNMSVRDNKPAIEIMAADQTPTLAASLQRPQSGIKRKSSQTNWTVPPRILLVDDDSVYRDLSGKLLQVIGCTIDLAKDGVEALKKMGLEKYDLILMVGLF
jgi:osomolarity two-component system response regulator SKN7